MYTALRQQWGEKQNILMLRFFIPSYASACTFSSVVPDDGEYPARNKRLNLSERF